MAQTAGIGTGAGLAVHPVTKDVWGSYFDTTKNEWGLYKRSSTALDVVVKLRNPTFPATATTVTGTGRNCIQVNHGSIIDPVRNLYVSTSPGDNFAADGHWLTAIDISVDPPVPVYQAKVTGLDSYPAWNRTGFCYDAINDKYLIADSEGRVFEVDPVSKAGKVLSSTTVAPTTDTSYGKLRWSDRLKGAFLIAGNTQLGSQPGIYFVPRDKLTALPNWRKGRQLFTSATIPGTSKSTLMFEGQVAFSGAAPDYLDGHAGFVLLAPGGQGINNVNQVSKIDLTQDNPKWVELLAATPNPANDVPYQADGHPSAMHLLHYTWVIRRHNYAVRLYGAAGFPNARDSATTDLFDLGLDRWVGTPGALAKPIIANRQTAAVATCGQHPVTEDIYYHNLQDSWVFRAASLTWEPWVSPQLFSYTGMLIDAARNREIIPDLSTNHRLVAIDLTTQVINFLPVTGAEGIPATLSDFSAITHDTDNDVYWYAQRLPSRTDIIRAWAINAKTLAVDRTIDLPYSDAGPFNRFFYFPALHSVMYVPQLGDVVCIPTALATSADGAHDITVIDSAGATWTLGSATTGGFKTLKDGVWTGNGAGVLYVYFGGSVYVKNDTGAWSRWSGTSFVSAGILDPSLGSTSLVGKRLKLSRFADGNYIDSVVRTGPAPTDFGMAVGYGLTAAWAHSKGDWRDKNNESQGPVDFGNVTITAQGQALTIDLDTNLINKLRTDPTGLYVYMPNYTGGDAFKVGSDPGQNLRLVVHNTQGQTFTLNPTIQVSLSLFNPSQAGAGQMFLPAAATYDFDQITGVVSSAQLLGLNTYAPQVPQKIAVQFLDPPIPLVDPLVQTPSQVVPGIRGEVSSETALKTHPEIIHYYDMKDLNTLYSEWNQVPTQFSQATGNPDWRNPFIFLTWPEYGVNAVEVDQVAYNRFGDIYYSNTITSWRSKVPNLSSLRKIYLAYSFIIVDIAQSAFPVKMPGMESAGSSNGGIAPLNGWFDLRIQHSMESPDNPGIVRFWPHYYYTDWFFGPNYTGAAKTTPLTDQFGLIGQVITVEQEVILESGFQVSDGSIRLHINGRLCHEELNVNLGNGDVVNGMINDVHHNFFAGGQGLEYGQMKYQMGPVVIGTRWIGPLLKTGGALPPPPPPVLPPPPPIIPPPPPPPTPVSPFGYMDDATCTTARGWAVDQAHPANQVTVVITSDGIEVARVVADQTSPDVLAAGFGNGSNRWVATYALAGGNHTISTVVLGTSFELRQSPKAITCTGTAPPPPPPPTGTASPDGTHATTITDSTGSVWTFGTAQSGGFKTLRNGVQVGGGGGVLYLYYHGEVYVKNDIGQWFHWTGSWISIGGDPSGTVAPPPPPIVPPPPPVTGASPDGTTATTITDSSGNTWTLGATTTGGKQTLKNGAVVGTIGGTLYLFYSNNVYLQIDTGKWYQFAGSNWILAPGSSGSVPLWLRNKTVNVPFQIPQTSPYAPGANGAPSVWYGANIIQYSGYAADRFAGRAKWYGLAIGGHANGGSSKVAMIDFNLDQPTWVELFPDATPENLVLDVNGDHNLDGTPIAGHTYLSAWCVGRLNVGIRVEQTAGYPGARSYRNSDYFFTDTKKWNVPYTANGWPERPNFRPDGHGSLGPSWFCQDKDTEEIYWSTGNLHSKFVPADRTWHTLNNAPFDSNYSAGEVDTIRKRAWVYGGGSQAWINDLTTDSWQLITLLADLVHGFPFDGFNHEYMGMTWDWDHDLLWFAQHSDDGSTCDLWTIHPTTFQLTFKYHIAESPGSGPLNRFTYFGNLKGIALHCTNDIFFIPTTAPGPGDGTVIPAGSDPRPNPTPITPVGYANDPTPTSIAGWAFDRGNPTAKLVVTLVVNGVVQSTQIANHARPDVLAAGFGDGFNGFEFDYPSLAPGSYHFDCWVGGVGSSRLTPASGLDTIEIIDPLHPDIPPPQTIRSITTENLAVTSGPLFGNLTVGGSHLAAIAGLGARQWVNLGTPADDPVWGQSLGRSWNPKMPYSESLQCAFTSGQGPHGAFTVRSDGHRHYDDVFAYHLGGHKWINIDPGINEDTYGADAQSGKIVIGAAGYQIYAATGRPVYASGAHSYAWPHFDSHRGLLIIPGWGPGLAGDQFSTGDPWYEAARPYLTPQLNANSSIPPGMFAYNVLTGALTRAGSGVLDGHFYIPSLDKNFEFYLGKTYLAGVDTGATGRVPGGFGVHDFGSCMDLKRNRIYIGSLPGEQPYSQVFIYDVDTNQWHRPTYDGIGILPTGGAGHANFDDHADRMITFYDDGQGGGHQLGVWNPETFIWEEVIPIPFGRRSGPSAFYSRLYNVHIIHNVTDGAAGEMWAYRHVV
jgi:hypothetical protein